MANSWFAGLQKKFVLVSIDTKHGYPDLVKPFKVRRNYTYLIVINTDGKAVLKLERIFSLNEAAKQKIEQAWQQLVRGNADVLRYALSYGKSADDTPAMVKKLVGQLGSDDFVERETAAKDLLGMGEVGRLQLVDFETDDEEVRWRVESILATWNSLHRVVEREGLDHHIDYLSQHAATFPQAAHRLASILPKSVDRGCAVSWWKDNHHQFTFDPVAQRYVSSLDKSTRSYETKR